MKPLIGITTYYVKASEMGKNRVRGLQDQDMLMSTMDYSRCIEKAGGIPVNIPVIEDEDYIDGVVNKLDGFLFSGGPDVNPLNYNQPIKKGLGKIAPERDIFELKLLKKVLEKDKPILGICRGYQLINVYFGGTLHQDINNNNLTDLDHVGIMGPKHNICHKVALTEGSKIHKVFNKKDVMVNSYHHQAIDKIGDKLIVTGKSEDGIIEAFEHMNHKFVMGVQWHPEMMSEIHKEQLNLFKLFINNIK